MCGIVGLNGPSDIPLKQILLESLKRLEYRGYDSAGVAVLQDGKLQVHKATGKLQVLTDKLTDTSFSSTLGIGHTRWATHGMPTDANSHPHISDDGKIVLVHNGIFENYIELGRELKESGYTFNSETDTEVLAHLIQSCYDGDLVAAVRKALQRVDGNYTVCVIHQDHPDLMVAARHQSPLIIGVGEGAHYVASDVPAILSYTRKVIYPGDKEVAAIRPGDVHIFDLEGNELPFEVTDIPWSMEVAEKEGYPHFMLKEIFEQPAALQRTLAGSLPADGKSALQLDLPEDYLRNISRIQLIACGTAYHAGMCGKYMLEQLAGIGSEAIMASEFRYGDPVIDENTLVIAVSQSGETADTLAAVHRSKEAGAKVLAICNVVGSTISREADEVLYIHCGPEIGVAATKTYTSMLFTLALLAMELGRVRGRISDAELQDLLQDVRSLPGKVSRFLESAASVKTIAEKYVPFESFMFIGRRYNFPTVCEAALKLKEISYLHAEGYAGGEMKHGPIALIDENFPTVAVATQDPTYVKMVSNIREIKARKGIVIAIATEGDQDIHDLADDIMMVAPVREVFSPILNIVPLQLFAYHIATMNGKDVDQPRNLAKSVTVE